jgi:ferredoxin-NADP reductase
MIQVAGVILCAFIVAHVTLYIAATMRQLASASQRDQLVQRLLLERISAANALRVQREQAQRSWSGTRKFEVRKKQFEAEDQCSFYLMPHDGRELPLFMPGQYLTFRLNIPGREKLAIRCYSLSDGPRTDYFRVTIKRVPPPRDKDVPPGLVSNYFHDHVSEGDILDCNAPRGDFFITPEDPSPVVLIGGGVGITPMLSMLTRLTEVNPGREVWLFYGVRSSADHAFKTRFEELAARNENIRLCICYSRPDKNDVEGKDYQFTGHASVDLFKRLLPSNNYEFYICGPPPMMTALTTDLKAWGVPDNRVFIEAFGKASAPKKKAISKDDVAGAAPKVKFGRAGKELVWSDEFDNILEFAEHNGIAMDSGCKAGNCGECEVALLSGKVSCHSAGAEIVDGSCLTCIAVPDGDIAIDA